MSAMGPDTDDDKHAELIRMYNHLRNEEMKRRIALDIDILQELWTRNNNT